MVNTASLQLEPTLWYREVSLNVTKVLMWNLSYVMNVIFTFKIYETFFMRFQKEVTKIEYSIDFASFRKLRECGVEVTNS